MKGAELKRIRVIAGFTAKEFAEHIDMSTSYVYSLETQYHYAEIPPRREEEFIEFLGPSVYKKARHIYEIELQKLRDQEELKKKRKQEEKEEEEQERIRRKQLLQEKKAKRDAELEEQIKAMENQSKPVAAVSEAKDTTGQHEDPSQSDENAI